MGETQDLGNGRRGGLRRNKGEREKEGAELVKKRFQEGKQEGYEEGEHEGKREKRG